MMYSWICFVVLLSTVTATPTPDEDGDTNIKKHYVLQYFSKMNWFLSFLSFQSNGMRLATIYSKTEEDQLKKLVSKAGLEDEHFWLSDADLGKEGHFSWYSTGDLFGYQNSKASQPDNYDNKQHCIEFSYHGAWNDIKCEKNYYYVCEKLLS